MFDLEQAVAAWREQMLVAGILSPTPLDELEGHLREEITRQIQAGATELQAFTAATAQIGRTDLLKSEFKKTGGFGGWLGQTRESHVTRILALFWLAYCFLHLISQAEIAADMVGWLSQGQHVSIQMRFFGILVTNLDYILLWTFVSGLIQFAGIIASLRLFVGRGGARMLLSLAFWNLALYITQISTALLTFSFFGIASTALYIISIWLLWPQKKLTPTME